VLDEFAGGQVGGGLARWRGEPLDHLVGIGEAPPPQVDHLLGILPQRLERDLPGLAEAQDHPRALEVGDLQHPVARLAALAVGEAAAHRHLLQAEPLGERRQPAHQGFEILRPQVDRRPDAEQYPVPLQALARGAAGLEVADAGQSLHQHVLQLGELDDAPPGVAHRSQVAHLGHGEQALVARVLAGHAVEEIDPVRGGEAVEMEALEAPELQPQGHQRMDAPIDAVLREGSVIRPPEGEVPHAGRPGEGDGHAAQPFRRRVTSQ
jgi:hypothetical protein